MGTFFCPQQVKVQETARYTTHTETINRKWDAWRIAGTDSRRRAKR
nr:hypothetical protein WMHIBSEC_WMHIBSEC_CDS_0015 [Caudoviricetes sp.]CAI9751679.1 hypothetical protein AZFZUZMX_AZFZUZMX_CDS_0015 [Caudoviricetes sp.]